MLVMRVDIVSNGRFEFASAAEYASPNLFSVSSANQRSTKLIQEAPVGVKCRWKRGRLSNHRWMVGDLWSRNCPK